MFNVIKGLFIILLAVGILFGVLFLLGCCWDYAVSTWLVYLDKPDTFEVWHGMLISLVPGFGQMSIPIVILTFLIMLFI